MFQGVNWYENALYTFTRLLYIESNRELTNGTYEVIGVRMSADSENILLSEVEETGSQERQLNVTA